MLFIFLHLKSQFKLVLHFGQFKIFAIVFANVNYNKPAVHQKSNIKLQYV